MPWKLTVVAVSTSSLGINIGGTLTHMSSLAVACFVLAVLSGATNQIIMAWGLFVLGIVSLITYMFLARKAYLEDTAKKQKASQKTPLSKVELLDMAMKTKNKYDHKELDAIYSWLNKP